MTLPLVKHPSRLANAQLNRCFQYFSSAALLIGVIWKQSKWVWEVLWQRSINSVSGNTAMHNVVWSFIKVGSRDVKNGTQIILCLVLLNSKRISYLMSCDLFVFYFQAALQLHHPKTHCCNQVPATTRSRRRPRRRKQGKSDPKWCFINIKLSCHKLALIWIAYLLGAIIPSK